MIGIRLIIVLSRLGNKSALIINVIIKIVDKNFLFGLLLNICIEIKGRKYYYLRRPRGNKET